MTKARTIAELHYPNKAGNRFDEKYRQSRINSLEKLITKQLTLTDVVSGAKTCDCGSKETNFHKKIGCRECC